MASNVSDKKIKIFQPIFKALFYCLAYLIYHRKFATLNRCFMKGKSISEN